MADDWESLVEEENIVIAPKIPNNLNKWEGEDEDDDVKDSWEDEEEKKDEEKIKEVKPAQQLQQQIKATNKKAQNKSNDKDSKKFENGNNIDDADLDNMTPEDKLAEKLRLQKIQIQEDLKTAMDTFGVTESPSGIDGMHPTNKTEFSEFAQALCKKILNYKNNDEFPGFIEELVRNLCATLNVVEVKKIKLTVENIHIEKQKIEKEKTKKPPGKGKTKVKLRVEEDGVRSNNIDDYQYDYDYGYGDLI